MPNALTVTAEVHFQAQFAVLDDQGDALSQTPAQGRLGALTPLACMELYEKLQSARNKVRKEAGLPEVTTPDEGVLILAFLRALRDEPAGSLREVLARFDETARTMQMNRLEGLTQADLQKAQRPGWPAYPCPTCKKTNDIRAFTPCEGKQLQMGAVCAYCQSFHTEDQWRAQLFVCDANGHEPPPLTEADLQAALAPSPWQGIGEGPTTVNPWHCPTCLCANEIVDWRNGKGESGAEAACSECGAVHSYQEWQRQQRQVAVTRALAREMGGEEPAEVAAEGGA